MQNLHFQDESYDTVTPVGNRFHTVITRTGKASHGRLHGWKSFNGVSRPIRSKFKECIKG